MDKSSVAPEISRSLKSPPAPYIQSRVSKSTIIGRRRLRFAVAETSGEKASATPPSVTGPRRLWSSPSSVVVTRAESLPFLPFFFFLLLLFRKAAKDVGLFRSTGKWRQSKEREKEREREQPDQGGESSPSRVVHTGQAGPILLCSLSRSRERLRDSPGPSGPPICLSGPSFLPRVPVRGPTGSLCPVLLSPGGIVLASTVSEAPLADAEH